MFFFLLFSIEKSPFSRVSAYKRKKEGSTPSVSAIIFIKKKSERTFSSLLFIETGEAVLDFGFVHHHFQLGIKAFQRLAEVAGKETLVH